LQGRQQKKKQLGLCRTAEKEELKNRVRRKGGDLAKWGAKGEG